MPPREAIFQASLLRFRPIMMTTMAAMFGALPLAFGTGDGAEIRQPLGISIVGGLIVSQVLTLYTTPGHLPVPRSLRSLVQRAVGTAATSARRRSTEGLTAARRRIPVMSAMRQMLLFLATASR